MAQGFGDWRKKDVDKKYWVNKRTEQFLFESWTGRFFETFVGPDFVEEQKLWDADEWKDNEEAAVSLHHGATEISEELL